jgi:hypothetical protein
MEIKKGDLNYFKSPLFCFHGNCKVCPTDSDLFGLSRSTSCGCCSYQVASIAVRRVPERSRVTYCYSTLLFHYYYYYSYYYSSTHICPLDFSEMPLSNFMKPCRNIIWSPDCVRGDVIIIRNGANTICLPNLVWGI